MNKHVPPPLRPQQAQQPRQACAAGAAGIAGAASTASATSAAGAVGTSGTACTASAASTASATSACLRFLDACDGSYLALTFFFVLRMQVSIQKSLRVNNLPLWPFQFRTLCVQRMPAICATRCERLNILAVEHPSELEPHLPNKRLNTQAISACIN